MMTWTHLADSTPKARKPYRCYLCGLAINMGDVHVKRTGVQDGSLNVARMHARCEAVTHKWTIDEWENHEPSGFREYDLKEAEPCR
jgi:hypothetical protein